jgi:amino acid adenylation domain-containing protein
MVNETVPAAGRDAAWRSVPELIVAQARRTPDLVAIRQWSVELTYRELVARAAALAADLRELGAGPEVRVGLCAGREPATVAALLGIWLAGAAYVPIDLGNPRPRCRAIVADAGLELVVADAAGRERLGSGGFRYLDPPGPDSPDPGGAVAAAAPPEPESLAYVMYTSGSTGAPKGVLTTHRNLAAWVAGCGDWAPGVHADMRALALHSLAFDASCYDLFVPLAAGGAVQLAGDEDRSDPARLQRLLAAHRVTWAAAPPAVIGLLDPAAVPSLEVLIVGGEVVAPHLVGHWTGGSRCRFFHAYGPTEATVVQVATELSGHWTEPLPLGTALSGQRLHVLDGNGDPVAAGQEGELCIAGAGIARGYLGRPDLTAERFVPEPGAAHPGARMYRTGDIVRRLPGGVVVFVGRRDGQVQVRGHRVEVGEIEATLRRHPAVANAAVVPTVVRQGTELVGFLAPAGGADAPEAGGVREFVAERLPAAMVPRHLEWLAHFPLTLSGKVDRTTLGARAARLAGRGGEPCSLPTTTGAPAGGLPTAPAAGPVAELWQRVLGGAAPAPEADFFAAGGHSVDAMRLVAALRDELARDVTTADVFAARTLAELTRRVDAAASLTAPELPAGQPPALSAAQRRMWFLDKLTPGFAAYNVVCAERLHGPVDPDALASALAAVAGRHDVLRWRIPDDHGQPVAVCDPPGPVPLPVVELVEEDLPAALARATGHAFDLAAGPLWSAILYRLVDHGDHVLVLVFHHAVMDGWSQAVLYADLAVAYRRAIAGERAELPPLAHSYADYVAWRARRDGARAADDLHWWIGHLRGAPAILDLPRDRPRGPVQRYQGSSISVDIDLSLDRAIRQLARTLGATRAMVVLAGLAEALRRLSGQTDLLVGSVSADRGLAGMQEVIGFFVDVMPLRIRTDATASFPAAVRVVADEMLATNGHPAASLDQIVGALRLPRDPGRSPLVQVVFNAYNFVDARLDLPEAAVEPVPVPMPGAPVELTVYLVERAGRYGFDLRYNSGLYDAGRIRTMGADLTALLAELVAHPDRPVGEAPTRFRTDGVAAPGPAPGSEPPEPAAAGGAGIIGRAGGTGLVTPTERLVAGVWGSVLEVPVGRATDNFFDVGGTSFALVQVQAQLSEAVGRSVPVVDLFRFPSVRALAAHLDGGDSYSNLIESAQLIAAQRARSRRRRHRAH